MRKKTVYVIALFMALVFGHEAFAQSQLQIQDIQSQLVGSPDSTGNVQFTVTATVLNPTMYGTQFSLQVQGVDGNGSPLTSVILSGRIGGRETGTMVGQGSMPLANYQSIVNWVQAN